MPLTNQAWQKNFRLQAATTGGNPLRKGDRGPHIAILRQNFQAVGFEQTLDAADYFGDSTSNIIRDFREMYAIPGSKDVADKVVLETLDAIFNGKIARKRFKDPQLATASAKGRDFAAKYLPTTKQWVDGALATCRMVEQSLLARYKAGGTASPPSSFASNVYLPFLQHFRLLICFEAAVDAAKSKIAVSLLRGVDDLDAANSTDAAAREVLLKVNKIANVFASIKLFLDKDPGTTFKDDAANARDVAYAPIPKEEIVFCGQQFFEVATMVPKGMDRKSASWVTIHEAGHVVLGNASLHGPGTGPGDNPYSYQPSYYQMTWQQATQNPDAYAHFAYQVAAGKQNLGPWV